MGCFTGMSLSSDLIIIEKTYKRLWKSHMYCRDLCLHKNARYAFLEATHPQKVRLWPPGYRYQSGHEEQWCRVVGVSINSKRYTPTISIQSVCISMIPVRVILRASQGGHSIDHVSNISEGLNVINYYESNKRRDELVIFRM